MLVPKAWDFYRFLPSVSSLILSLVVTPYAESLLAKRLKDFLLQEGFDGVEITMIEGVARDRGLQLASISTFFSTLFLLVSLAGVFDRGLLDAFILIVFVVGILVTISLLMKTPGFYSTTLVRSGWLRRRSVTYVDLFNVVLVVLNVVTVVLTALVPPQ
jgi:hypothetical protein